jgi:hypothetical protein
MQNKDNSKNHEHDYSTHIINNTSYSALFSFSMYFSSYHIHYKNRPISSDSNPSSKISTNTTPLCGTAHTIHSSPTTDQLTIPTCVLTINSIITLISATASTNNLNNHYSNINSPSPSPSPNLYSNSTFIEMAEIPLYTQVPFKKLLMDA